MTVASAIKRLIDAGFTVDQALLAGEIFEGEMMPQRSTAAIRQERYRRNKTSQSVTKRNSDGIPDKEPPPTPPKEINPSLPELRSDKGLFSARANKANLESEFLEVFLSSLSTQSSASALPSRHGRKPGRSLPRHDHGRA
jgi:hypothetical protein